MSAPRPDPVTMPADVLAPNATDNAVTAALRAFVAAYANIEGLDGDANEIAVFRAWLAGAEALGLRTTGQAKPRRISR